MWSLVLIVGLQVGAVTLPPIEPIQQNTLPVDVAEPNIPCAMIVDRLKNFQQMSSEHQTGVSNFLFDVANKVQSWHRLLRPLEGHANAVPVGVFEPLRDGATVINDVAGVALDNAGLLANEMDLIQRSLEECVLTPR